MAAHQMDRWWDDQGEHNASQAVISRTGQDGGTQEEGCKPSLPHLMGSAGILPEAVDRGDNVAQGWVKGCVSGLGGCWGQAQ